MADFTDIVSKALKDAGFCEALAADPEGTLRTSGVTPTPEIVDALKGLDAKQVKKLATAFAKNPAAL